MIAFIYSEIDLAGKTMAKLLEKQLPKNSFLHKVSSKIVDDNTLDQNLPQKADIIICLTKHASKSGIPSLCIHTQGNWCQADLGGTPEKIGVCPVVLRGLIYQEMVARNKLSFEVVNEATHHGPDIETPCIFVEVGSTEKEWGRIDAAQVNVEAIIAACTKYGGENTETPVVFGVGGMHTCTNYNSLAANGSILLSHVLPNHHIDNITSDSFIQGISRSTVEAQIVVDWKALNALQRAKIQDFCESNNLHWQKLKSFKKQVRDSQSI